MQADLMRREHVPGLEELRLQVVEWRVDAGLELGFHGELMADLQSLAAAHPLRERAVEQSGADVAEMLDSGDGLGRSARRSWPEPVKFGGDGYLLGQLLPPAVRASPG